MVQIFLNLLKRLRKFLLWVWQQEGTPAQRALGMAIGVFSGCFPFFGFQTLLGVILASLFRGNRLLAATGTWISNPFTYLPLYWLNYKIGSSLLSNKSGVPELTTLTRQELWDQGWFFSSRLLLGSTLMGMILGLITGLSLYFVFKFFSKD